MQDQSGHSRIALFPIGSSLFPGLLPLNTFDPMYTKAQEQQLYNEAKALIDAPDSPDQMQELSDILRWADWRYYVQSDPALADFEYDTLFKKLRKLEESYPDQISPDSPTQRVAKGLSERFPTVPHLVPMLSLDNTYNAEDLRAWDRKDR